MPNMKIISYFRLEKQLTRKLAAINGKEQFIQKSSTCGHESLGYESHGYECINLPSIVLENVIYISKKTVPKLLTPLCLIIFGCHAQRLLLFIYLFIFLVYSFLFVVVSRGRLDLAVPFTPSTPYRQNRNQVCWNICAGARRSTPYSQVV